MIETFTCDFCHEDFKSDSENPSKYAIVYIEEGEKDYACEGCWKQIKESI